MDNLIQFKKDFKRDLLVKVVINMKYGKASRPYASSLARKVIEIFEENDPKALFAKINKLAESQPDVLEIFIKRMEEYDGREVNVKIPQIIIFLKKGGAIN